MDVVKRSKGIVHYEIITLKITLKLSVVLESHGNHIENYLQRKPQ